MKKQSTVTKDLVMIYGDRDDGVIGIPALTVDGQVIEVSYFFGRKHPKNIIAISSQAGCPMRCAFCELGAARFARSLTAQEMRDQTELALEEAARYGFDRDKTPHKINVANSGEPLLNTELVGGLSLIGGLPKTIKVSTVFPDARIAWENFERLAEYACGLKEQVVQIQISLISTSEKERLSLSGGKVAGFEKIRQAAELWRSKNPQGRKINLSLMLTDRMACDIRGLSSLFPPRLFRLRLREYVPSSNGESRGLRIVTPIRLSSLANEAQALGYEAGDWASPTPTERKFGLAANAIRQQYLDMLKRAKGD